MENKTFEELALELSGSSKQEPADTTQVIEAEQTPIDNDSELDNPEDSIVDDNETDGAETATPTSETEDAPEEDTILDESNVELDDFDVVDTDTDKDKFDFTAISNALGVDVKSKDELVSSFENLKKEVSVLKEQNEAYTSGVPENLQKAIELAKTGGDFMSYLGVSSVDYNTIDPVELFEYEVTKIFTDKNGNVNDEELAEYLDGLSDVEKKIKGKEIQQGYINKQHIEQETIRREAAEKKSKSDAKLQKVIGDIDTIAGFKLKSNQKEQMFNDISSGKMINELFYNKTGEYDFEKIVQNYFKVKNFDKIQSFYKQRVATATKKEIINDISNPKLSASVHRPNPDSAGTKKSALDNYLSQLRGD